MPVPEALASELNIPTKSPCPECGSMGNEQFYKEHIERLNALNADLKQKLESQRNKRLQEQDSRDDFAKLADIDNIAMVELDKFRDRLIAAGNPEVE